MSEKLDKLSLIHICFKIGTIGEKKPEDWIVVEGQHEPLIDRMSFDIVQNLSLIHISWWQSHLHKSQYPQET